MRADDDDAAITRRSMTRAGVRGIDSPHGEISTFEGDRRFRFAGREGELRDPSGACGRYLTRWAVFVDVLGEFCPSLRHVEEDDLAG
jgi:hypothetical protein